MSKLSQTTNEEPVVKVENLNVRFGNRVILEDISFEVNRGDIAAVIGPNGSGKSTLIKAILGIVKPVSGSISLFGKHLHEVRRQIGYVPQKFEFDPNFPITVQEFLQLALHSGKERNLVTRTIKEVGLLPNVLDKQLGVLSGGQLQRVLIAQSIINDPDLLILDEPATGIDIVGEAAFYDVVDHLNKDHDTTVILISHDVSMVSQRVDHVLCLNKQLLCTGPPNVALTESTLKAVFGETQVYEHDHHEHEHDV